MGTGGDYRHPMNAVGILASNRILASLIILLACDTAVAALSPFQANGIKIGEVTGTTAIVWVRLTQRSKRGSLPSVWEGKKPGKKRAVQGQGRAEKQDAEEWVTWTDVLEESAPGTSGYVRIRHRAKAEETRESFKATPWTMVNDSRDYTHQFTLRNLRPNERYEIIVESSSLSGVSGEKVRGGFRTAPSPNESERVVFTVISCTPRKSDRDDGYNVYPQMQKLDPNFFVHTGDIVYYDNFVQSLEDKHLQTTVDTARHHWHWAYTWPTNIDFHRQVSSYFMKDDHDTWQNDCYPTMKPLKIMEQFTFAQGQDLFLEQVPMAHRTYRTYRWGKHLQIWLVEGRDFRSPNDAPDGPGKTIWGREQLEWFVRTVRRSSATFRVLISPTPIVGPDRNKHEDNHANRAFKYEGAFLRRFIASQENMIVICGDRHWQYMSVHPKVGLREYSVGPTTDEHSAYGGKSTEKGVGGALKYVNVTTGGFLSATVDTVDDTPSLMLRFHGVMGNINYEDNIVAVTKEEHDERRKNIFGREQRP